jgi:hypothetical protein
MGQSLDYDEETYTLQRVVQVRLRIIFLFPLVNPIPFHTSLVLPWVSVPPDP